MRICADENIPDDAIALLRTAGHDVLSVSEYRPGLTDADVLQLAYQESRILITFDKKDFGELIFLRGATPPPALILFRIADISVEDKPRFMLQVIEGRTDWESAFSTVSSAGTRSRPFPR